MRPWSGLGAALDSPSRAHLTFCPRPCVSGTAWRNWLEPVELKLRAPIGGPEQPGLDKLLGAQEELDRQAGHAQAFVREGHCLAQDVEEQAQRLLQR